MYQTNGFRAHTVIVVEISVPSLSSDTIVLRLYIYISGFCLLILATGYYISELLFRSVLFMLQNGLCSQHSGN